MTNLERRIALLEGRIARLEAREITEGTRDNKHLGKKTREVLEQELTAHKQSFQETFNHEERSEWNKKLRELQNELEDVE
jgi:ribonuclease HII